MGDQQSPPFRTARSRTLRKLLQRLDKIEARDGVIEWWKIADFEEITGLQRRELKIFLAAVIRRQVVEKDKNMQLETRKNMQTKEIDPPLVSSRTKELKRLMAQVNVPTDSLALETWVQGNFDKIAMLGKAERVVLDAAIERRRQALRLARRGPSIQQEMVEAETEHALA